MTTTTALEQCETCGTRDGIIYRRHNYEVCSICSPLDAHDSCCTLCANTGRTHNGHQFCSCEAGVVEHLEWLSNPSDDDPIH